MHRSSKRFLLYVKQHRAAIPPFFPWLSWKFWAVRFRPQSFAATQRIRLYISLFFSFGEIGRQIFLEFLKLWYAMHEYRLFAFAAGSFADLPKICLVSSASSTDERHETGKAFLIVPAYWQLVYLPRKTDYTRFPGSYSRKLK